MTQIMETKIIFKDFNPDYYEYDQNDDPLGGGSYGQVFRAQLKEENAHTGLPKESAVKIIKWNRPGKGYEETELNLLDVGLNFRNENLVQIYSLSLSKTKTKGMQAIFMELCEESLDDFRKKTAKQDVSLDDLKYVTKGILSGLAHLHDLKIIHRDVKLQNVLLKTKNGGSSLRDKTIKLTDFNVSKWSPEDDRTPTQTSEVGTAGFRAPEVLVAREDGKTYYDTPADVWALGVLVYFFWTRDAFANEEEIRSEQIDDVIDSKIKTIPDAGLQQFLRECLKKIPKERPTACALLNHRFL